MGVARLVAEIGADASGFERTMGGLEHVADKAGNKISRKLDKAFGTGLIAGTAVHFVKEIFAIPTARAKDIEDHAAKLHVTSEEYQMLDLAAKDAGKGIDDFIESMSEQPGGMRAAIEALESYRKKILLTNEEAENLGGSKYWSGLKDWWTKKTAGAVGFLGNAATMAVGLFQGNSLDESAAGIKEANKQRGFNDEVPSAGLQDILTLSGRRKILSDKNRGLRTKLEGLQDEATSIQRDERKNHGTLWSPQFTDWQEAGAHKNTMGVVSPADKSNEKLDAIADEIKQTNRQMEENRNAMQDVAEQLKRLAGGNGGGF